MDLGIEGRSALVWGGSRGMGRAAAAQLAREGVEVTIAARNREVLESAAAELSVKSVVADLTTAQGRAAALAACPAPDIPINNLLPGIFDSDAQRQHVRSIVELTGKEYADVWQARAKENPAGRYGRPEEAGAYIAFLCSAHAGFITGQNLMIDGGQYPG